MDYQTANQGSSATKWYIVGVVVIVALGIWYFIGKAPATETQQATDTTAVIESDLSAAPDTTAALNADAAASAQTVQGF